MKRDNSMTRRFFEDAGITTGMRVLELGCGGGEVTQELAELVGPTGHVVALDKNEYMLTKARRGVAAAGIRNVQFVSADVAADDIVSKLEALTGEKLFDAIAGRRVLMYLADPAAVLERLVDAKLRRAGLVVFEEMDASTMVPATTSQMPAHDQSAGWLKSMLEKEGANTSMGFALPKVYSQAGLRLDNIRAEAIINGQGTQFALATLVEFMQPRLVSSRIAKRAEIKTFGKDAR